MINENRSASEKILAVLVQLRTVLDEPKGIALSAIFQFNELAKEYCTYVLDDEIIIRVSGGKAGRAKYQWNKNIEPTPELASLLADRYSKTRMGQSTQRNARQLSKTDKIFIAIEEIKRMQTEILNKLSR